MSEIFSFDSMSDIKYPQPQSRSVSTLLGTHEVLLNIPLKLIFSWTFMKTEMKYYLQIQRTVSSRERQDVDKDQKNSRVN